MINIDDNNNIIISPAKFLYFGLLKKKSATKWEVFDEEKCKTNSQSG